MLVESFMKKILFNLTMLAGGLLVAATGFCAATYNVDFGYGTFNLNLQADTPITQLSFEYGNADFKLQNWGTINSTNATVNKTSMGNGLYEYTITPKQAGKNFGTTAGFSQVPLLPQTVPTKNMDFSNYYGLFQQIKVNGKPAQYAKLDSAATNPTPGKLSGAYYADWTEYPGHGDYKPTDIPFQNLNTIYYAFGSLNPDTGAAQMFDPYADVQMAGVNALPYFSLVRQQYPYMNLIYSFGGWGSIENSNFQSGDFSVLFTYYPQNISVLAKSMIAAMVKTGFNGIDIDYEWQAPFESNPKVLNGHAPLCVADKTNPQYCVTAPLTQAEADGYAQLIYELRQDMNQLPDAKNDLLTVALFAGPDKLKKLADFKYHGSVKALQNISDLKIVLDNVSYADLMTYDYHGAFDAPAKGAVNPKAVSDFQSRFAASPNSPNDNGYNVIDSVKALKSLDPNDANFPAAKIIIGVPAYARIVKLDAVPKTPSASQKVGIFDPLANASEQGVPGADVAGEFQGDDSHQYVSGGGADAIGSTIFDYKCIAQFPSDANSPYCYYGAYHGSHPIPADMQFYGMKSLPKTTSPGGYAATPWGFGNQSLTFMSFDNQRSAANKAKYVLNQHLGGLMIWEIDGDIPPSDVGQYQSQSLVYSICSTLAQKPCIVPQ